ncbi:hypothetical protein EV208_1026 [Christensenella hongkongensis]|uniref:Uncharacterized protein n=1 Tax=Christensenella hongkongensis TaxID=270498 RepID=A0A0M2NJR5_9FIRM|nr:hypothetical protein CHK_1598 [Christensenella hongkongensis]TCW30386.1 hypothetical protein EV208_1026 [Christensenella hongkongensis]
MLISVNIDSANEIEKPEVREEIDRLIAKYGAETGECEK